jgi:hypothetical protein
MKPFLFSVEILALPQNRQVKIGTRAIVNVIAFSKNIKTAKKLAFDLIAKDAWKVVAIEFSGEIDDARPQGDPQFEYTFAQAKTHGVAAEYVIEGHENLNQGRRFSDN